MMQCVAFKDINAQAPVHFLVVPREPIPKLADAKDSQEQVGIADRLHGFQKCLCD